VIQLESVWVQHIITYPAPDRSVRSSLSADGDSTDTMAHVDEERMEAWVKTFVKEDRQCLRVYVTNDR
jgi:hypothetical protein